tara:strand:+ start:23 stop:388 length:366 start_codon:yes stop_codon:yes gene_type:complete
MEDKTSYGRIIGTFEEYATLEYILTFLFIGGLILSGTNFLGLASLGIFCFFLAIAGAFGMSIHRAKKYGIVYGWTLIPLKFFRDIRKEENPIAFNFFYYGRILFLILLILAFLLSLFALFK